MTKRIITDLLRQYGRRGGFSAAAAAAAFSVHITCCGQTIEGGSSSLEDDASSSSSSSMIQCDEEEIDNLGADDDAVEDLDDLRCCDDDAAVSICMQHSSLKGLIILNVVVLGVCIIVLPLFTLHGWAAMLFEEVRRNYLLFVGSFHASFRRRIRI